MGRKSKTTAEQKQAEIDLYLSGKSCRDISEITGRSTTSIQGRLKRAGVLRSLPEAMDLALRQGKIIKLTPEMGDRVRKLRDQGKSYAAIGKELSVSHVTVKKAEKLPADKKSKKRVKREPVDTRIPYELFKKMRDQGQVNAN